jgi:protease secretion system membrane fusion protein
MKLISNTAQYEAAPLALNTDETAYARVGWLIVLVGVGGFLLWALMAPLDKGVPLNGNVTKASNRQAVQHRAGGTIQQILVQDGDVVKAGQVLVRMNPIVARSEVELTDSQALIARAVEARLEAERDGTAAIHFGADLVQRRKEPQVANILRLQESLLNSRRASLRNELGGMDENIAGLEEQIHGLQKSHDSKKEQVNFLKEQLAGMRDLAKDGYVARNRLLELERTFAQLNSELAEDIGNIGHGRRQVSEMRLRKAQRVEDYHKEVRAQLTDVTKEANAQLARLQAQRFELSSVDVKAPADGTVVGRAVFTPGGVVPPGFKMMEIVPSNDPLVVEGQLPVNLVDRVHPGLKTDLVFSAFNASRTPHIEGEVEQVAADRTVDERNGTPYYLVRVRVTPKGAQMIVAHRLEIRPGMPVELFVKTGERTMMNYLIKPVVDRARSALTEE